MKAFEVVEQNTPEYCAFHGVEVGREPEDVVSCPLGHKLRSDLNGALNFIKKATDSLTSTVKKPLSFLWTTTK